MLLFASKPHSQQTQTHASSMNLPSLLKWNLSWPDLLCTSMLVHFLTQHPKWPFFAFLRDQPWSQQTDVQRDCDAMQQGFLSTTHRKAKPFSTYFWLPFPLSCTQKILCFSPLLPFAAGKVWKSLRALTFKIKSKIWNLLEKLYNVRNVYTGRYALQMYNFLAGKSLHLG